MFVSRVAIGVSAADILAHARMLTKGIHSVARWKTLHDSNSSIVIRLNKEKELKISTLNSWRTGTFLKLFRDRVLDERVYEKAVN